MTIIGVNRGEGGGNVGGIYTLWWWSHNSSFREYRNAEMALNTTYFVLCLLLIIAFSDWYIIYS